MFTIWIEGPKGAKRTALAKDVATFLMGSGKSVKRFDNVAAANEVDPEDHVVVVIEVGKKLSVNADEV